MIKAVLFDLDGVLVDTGDVHYAALNLALNENHCAMIEPWEHSTLYNGLPTARKLEMLVEKGLLLRDAIPIVALRKKHHTTFLLKERVKFDPEIYCLLAGIYHSGKKLGVVSNAIRSTVETVCKTLRVSQFVLNYVTNEDGPPKPDPYLYRFACRKFNVHPREALVVEDGKYGIESAREAGCRVLEVRDRSEVTATRVWGAMCSQS